MADVELLRILGTIKRFKKRQTVFCQNDTGTDMYIVLRGLFGVYINSLMDFPIRVAGIGANSFFGEMAALDGSIRSATVIAEEDSTVIVIKKENFGVLLEKSPEIAEAVMETLRKRISDTVKTVKKAGIEIAPISPIFKDIKFENAEISLPFMRSMSAKVREMNELLSITPETHWVDRDAKEKETVCLLPGGFTTLESPRAAHDPDCLRRIAFTCPYCYAETKTYIPLVSGLIKSKEFPDGRIIYKNLDVLRYTNVVCANCNYTDTYLVYSKPKSYEGSRRYEGNQFENVEDFTGYKDEKNRTLDEAAMSYYLNLECLKWVTKDPLRYGKAWIRLYWIYSDCGQEIPARQAAQRTHHYYSKYLNANAATLTADNKKIIDAILKETSVYIGPGA